MRLDTQGCGELDVDCWELLEAFDAAGGNTADLRDGFIILGDERNDFAVVVSGGGKGCMM